MIKLIAFDMDGTLLNSKGEILNESISAILNSKNKGCKIVLASGRPFDALKKYLHQLLLCSENEYSICFNGSKIVNNLTKEVIFFKKLDNFNISEANKLSKELNLSLMAYSKQEEILYENLNDDILFEYNLTKNPLKQVMFNNYQEEVIKILFSSTKENIDRTYNLIKNKYSQDYNVVRTHDKYIEIINKNVSKGNALKYLLSYLKINKEDTMSFGDNDNDISLLLTTKYSYAMKNSSSSELKNIATEVITSNDDIGIAQTINKFFN